MAAIRKSPSAWKDLSHFFHRNGYVRWQNAERRQLEGQAYRKGDEVRLVAESLAELATIRRLLSQAGFAVSRPFAKGRQFRQTIYGRDQVARFLAYVSA